MILKTSWIKSQKKIMDTNDKNTEKIREDVQAI